MSWQTAPLGEFMAKRVPSVNPARTPGETYELFSIPSYDVGASEVLEAEEIGSSKKLVEQGDVLLSRIVPHIRRSWVVRPRTHHRTIASGEWIVFRSKDLHPGYLRHFLLSDTFHPQLMNTVAGVGGSLLRARPDGVAQIEIPLPPLQEQKRIAAILDQADALRRLRQRAIDRLDTLSSSIFSGSIAHFHNAKKTLLKDFADIQIGYPFKSAKYSEQASDIRLCRGANVAPGTLDWHDVRYWPSNQAEHYREFALEPGDIVVAMDRPWISSGFKRAMVQHCDVPSLLVQRVARLRAASEQKRSFLYALISSEEFTRHFRPTETTIPHISPTEIRNFPIADLDNHQLENLHNKLSGVKAYREKAVHALAVTKRNFSSLQQRAFRGER